MPFTLLAFSISILALLLTAIIYRLYLHPLSHIPGPRLAALTYYYQAYYDIYPNRGQFLFHTAALHARYGPIVRIGPNEVHVNDIAFYPNMYPTGTQRRRDKSAEWFWFAGLDEFTGRSAFATLDHGLHRVRRGAFAGFFSRGKVLELQPRIRAKVEALRESLLRREGTGEVVDLRDACGALTLEVITEYCFGAPIPALDSDDYAKVYNDMLRSSTQIHPVGRAFPTLTRTVLRLAESLMEGNEAIVENKRKQKDVDKIAKAAYDDALRADKPDEEKWTTAIREMVGGDALPPEEKTLQRIMNDAYVFVGAGMETTGRTLAVTLYHILANPEIHQRLMKELRGVIPSSTAPMPDVSALEKLPFLTAVLTEGIRMSHGTAGRLARVAPGEDLDYHGLKIPRGTTMSQSSYLIHTNPAIFPAPFEFHPERFMGDGAAEAHKSMVAFGRGTRMCVGMNLAWAELYLTIAMLLTSVKMELWETTERDATVTMEFFLGTLPFDSKGIRVRILGKL